MVEIYNPAAAVTTVANKSSSKNISKNSGDSNNQSSSNVSDKRSVSRDDASKRTDKNAEKQNNNKVEKEVEHRISQLSIDKAAAGDSRLSAETALAVADGKLAPTVAKIDVEVEVDDVGADVQSKPTASPPASAEIIQISTQAYKAADSLVGTDYNVATQYLGTQSGGAGSFDTNSTIAVTNVVV